MFKVKLQKVMVYGPDGNTKIMIKELLLPFPPFVGLSIQDDDSVIKISEETEIRWIVEDGQFVVNFYSMHEASCIIKLVDRLKEDMWSVSEATKRSDQMIGVMEALAARFQNR